MHSTWYLVLLLDHPFMCTQAEVLAHACTHARFTHAHAQAHAHEHAHLHARAHTRQPRQAHTHASAHTQACDKDECMYAIEITNNNSAGGTIGSTFMCPSNDSGYTQLSCFPDMYAVRDDTSTLVYMLRYRQEVLTLHISMVSRIATAV